MTEVDDIDEGFGFEGFALDVAGLAGQEDVEELAELVAPGTSAAVVAIELLFAKRLAERLAAAGGVVLSNERIPALSSTPSSTPQKATSPWKENSHDSSRRSPRPPRARRPHRGRRRNGIRRQRRDGREPRAQGPGAVRAGAVRGRSAAGRDPAAAQQAVAAQQAPQPAAPAVDIVAELQKLAALKEAGVLTDEEFAAAKAKLLG